MKRFVAYFSLIFLSGCLQPLHETDYPLYQEYTYWQSADDDWHYVDDFRIQSFKTYENGVVTLRLIPQRLGMPSTEKGYIQAAQKAAFNIIDTDCSDKNFKLLPYVASRQMQQVDEFFYQQIDKSIGVHYKCMMTKSDDMDLFSEQKKWSFAEKRQAEINNIEANVDILPETQQGVRQMKIRLFGGDRTDNRMLARRIMVHACPSTRFDIVQDVESIDITPQGRMPDIISDDNIRVYQYVCEP